MPTSGTVNNLIVAATNSRPNASSKETVDRAERRSGKAGTGYHYLVLPSGLITYGRPLDRPGNFIVGYNKDSIGIGLVGGKDASGKPGDNFTPAAKWALGVLLFVLSRIYTSARICGSNELVQRNSPYFNVPQFYQEFLGAAQPSEPL